MREVKPHKVYTSFHDIPPREYMYFPKGSLDAGKPGKFSRVENNHILISIVVLTFVLALLFTRNNLFYGLTEGFKLDIFPYWLMVSFFGVVTAFFFHEMSHKFMAQKYGLWSEFRMYPRGLLFALLLGIMLPFVFAAPGAVMFRGGSRYFETGRIAMAGPLSNLIIAAITLMLYRVLFFENIVIGSIICFVCFINALFATFNLLPFGPLDGTKIISWNPTIWIIMLILSAVVLMTIMPNALSIL